MTKNSHILSDYKRFTFLTTIEGLWIKPPDSAAATGIRGLRVFLFPQEPPGGAVLFDYEGAEGHLALWQSPGTYAVMERLIADGQFREGEHWTSLPCGVATAMDSLCREILGVERVVNDHADGAAQRFVSQPGINVILSALHKARLERGAAIPSWFAVPPKAE